MTEIAALGLKITSTDVVRATGELVKFTGAAGSAERIVQRLGGTATRAGSGVATLGRGAATAMGSLHRLAAVAGTIIGRFVAMAGAALSVGAYIRLADVWSDMQSRVGAAIKDMSAAPALLLRLADVANASYAPLNQTVETYARNSLVLRQLGLSAQQTADFTESLNHMLVITATKGERAASVQNALSKAMAVGKLNGDGLETVLANGARVAEALATKLGTTVNGLRDMAAQGKITSGVIAGALLDSLEDVREEAGEMPATVADGFTRIGTGIQVIVGVFDQLSKTSGSLAGVLVAVGDALLNVGRWISENGQLVQTVFVSIIGAAVVGATVLVSRYAASMVMAAGSTVMAAVATGTLSGALGVLSTAISATGIGAFVVVAGILVGQFARLVSVTGSLGEAWTLVKDVAAEAFERIRDRVGAFMANVEASWKTLQASAQESFSGVVDNGVVFANRLIGVFRGSFEAIKEIFKDLPAALGSLMIETANAVIRGVEDMVRGAASLIDTFTAGAANTWFGRKAGITGSNLAGSIDFGEIDNPYKTSGSNVTDAFMRGFNTDTVGDIGGGMRDNAARMRAEAEAYREAARILQESADRPMTAWAKMKELLFGTNEVVNAMVDAANNASNALQNMGDKGAGAARKTKEAMEDLKSATSEFKNTLSSAFVGLVTGATKLRDAVGNVIGKLAEMSAMRAFEILWEGGLGEGVSSFLGRWLGFKANALGAVYDSPGLSAYSNSIVSQPTLFPFARGVGLMGEAGPEAIMPLKRGPDGRLGVSAQGGPSKIGMEIQITGAGNIRAIARDEAGNVLAQREEGIVERATSRSVARVGNASRNGTKSYLGVR